MRQELQKLLLLDHEKHPSRPVLTEDGRVRLKNSSGQIVPDLPWAELVERCPTFFSNHYRNIRGREAYGAAVHGHFVRVARQLSSPPFQRTDSWIDCHFPVFEDFGHLRGVFFFAVAVRFFYQEFLQLLHDIRAGTLGTVADASGAAGQGM